MARTSESVTTSLPPRIHTEPGGSPLTSTEDPETMSSAEAERRRMFHRSLLDFVDPDPVRGAIADVERPDSWDDGADQRSGEEAPPLKPFAEKEDQTFVLDDRAKSGELGPVGGEGDVEPMVPVGLEIESRAVNADAYMGQRPRWAASTERGRKRRRKPGRDPETGALIPAPPTRNV